MAQVSIDTLETKKSLSDLDSYGKGHFGLGEDFVLSFIFDDIVLVEFVDEVTDNAGDAVMRGGIFVPTNALIKAWRKAKVILVGPSVFNVFLQVYYYYLFLVFLKMFKKKKPK